MTQNKSRDIGMTIFFPPIDGQLGSMLLQFRHLKEGNVCQFVIVRTTKLETIIMSSLSFVVLVLRFESYY